MTPEVNFLIAGYTLRGIGRGTDWEARNGLLLGRMFVRTYDVLVGINRNLLVVRDPYASYYGMTTLQDFKGR